MNGMTTQERYDDICKICGMSEDIVRRVLNAEKKSITKSLKLGERATLIGRCVIRPEIKNKLVVGGEITSYIKLAADVAASLEASLTDMSEFDTSGKTTENIVGIRLNQIPSLV